MRTHEYASRVKVGIVGLGRWAKVLTRASNALRQARDRRRATAAPRKSARPLRDEMGVPAVPDLKTMLRDPEIKGVILTVPNEQHLPLAREVAKAEEARLHREADRRDAGGRA